jgi:hypothetical protein
LADTLRNFVGLPASRIILAWFVPITVPAVLIGGRAQHRLQVHQHDDFGKEAWNKIALRMDTNLL